MPDADRARARVCRRPSTDSTRVRKLEREIAALERKLRTEPQLNRKVELRGDSASKAAALVDLTNPTHRDPEQDAEDHVEKLTMHSPT